MTFGAYAGVALALGLVLVLLGVSLKLLQRLAPGTTRGRVRIPMEVVQRLSLGPKQGIAVVRIGERYVAVSLGEGGVRRLYALTDEEAALVAMPAVAPAAALSLDFRTAFKGAMRTAGVGAALLLLFSVSAAAQSATPAALSSGATLVRSPLPFSLQRTGAPSANPMVGRTAPGSTTPTSGATVQALIAAATSAAGSSATATPSAQTNAAAALVAARAKQSAAPSVTSPVAPTVATPNAGADLAVSKLAPQMDLRVGGGKGDGLRLSGTVGIVIMMGLLTLLPTLLLMMTSFTRILIVLHFLRQALGTQNAPPAQLVAAMALLLTGFVMGPTLTAVNRDALQPWMNGQIEQGVMLEKGAEPFKKFMLRQTRQHDLEVFVDLSHSARPKTVEEVPLITLMSAFVTSELRTSFQIGFALFLPFIIIDVVVSSVLMSMGMFMLPPAMISLPFKLLLFVLVDGWTLIVQSLVASFR